MTLSLQYRGACALASWNRGGCQKTAHARAGAAYSPAAGPRAGAAALPDISCLEPERRFPVCLRRLAFRPPGQYMTNFCEDFRRKRPLARYMPSRFPVIEITWRVLESLSCLAYARSLRPPYSGQLPDLPGPGGTPVLQPLDVGIAEAERDQIHRRLSEIRRSLHRGTTAPRCLCALHGEGKAFYIFERRQDVDYQAFEPRRCFGPERRDIQSSVRSYCRNGGTRAGKLHSARCPPSVPARTRGSGA